MIINGNNFYGQPIDSDLKQYKEIRKLITEKGENYTIGCLLSYEYGKNHYSLIPVDLSRLKELDVELKSNSTNKIFSAIKKCRWYKF